MEMIVNQKPGLQIEGSLDENENNFKTCHKNLRDPLMGMVVNLKPGITNRGIP